MTTYQEIDTTKVDNVELDGINTRDYPDFTDAYIVSADYEGKPMTDEQLDQLNEMSGYIHEQVMEYFF